MPIPATPSSPCLPHAPEPQPNLPARPPPRFLAPTLCLPLPQPAPSMHLRWYVHKSGTTNIAGEQPAPDLAREVGTGQGSCAVASRCTGLEPCEPQYRPVSQVRRHRVVSAVARGQVGGRGSAAQEGAHERAGEGGESASHRCIERHAITYPHSTGSTELLFLPSRGLTSTAAESTLSNIAPPSPSSAPQGGGALQARPSPRPRAGACTSCMQSGHVGGT